ncbi:MAG: GAF domain-containing protein [Candidatus Eisenbacteria sp.]|nr:GAF domain-containing protein [Candidatus Eisenbacteria bacterium]
MLSLSLMTLNSHSLLWTLCLSALIGLVLGWRAWALRGRTAECRAQDLAEKRANNLARILDISNTMNATLELDQLLTCIAQAVRESLGFRRVLVRLLDEETETFKACAFAGLDEEDVIKLRHNEVPLEEFRGLMKDEFRIGGSYFINHEAQYWDEDDDRLVIPDLGERQEGEWHPLDSLFVPLRTRDRRLIGYLSVDDPVDRQVPSTEAIETLEIFSNHAVISIENARLYRELEGKIRELKWVTAKLEELNQTKNAFMANVSHELRTPLTSIRAYLDTVMTEVGPRLEGQHNHFLKVILEETMRLTGLVDDLLDFSRMEAGGIELNREPLKLERVARGALSVLEPEVQQKGLTLIPELPDTEPILADRNLTMQLVLNLLRNAVKFTPPGGTIRVRVEGDEKGALLEVRDTGIGISRENLGRVFDRFYQTDSSSTREYGGVGLGLSICRSIVGRHGGRIWAESKEGEGSSFMVWLPRRESVCPETTAMGRPRRVPDLIVQLIAEVMQSGSASIMLVDEKREDLFIETSLGLDQEIIENTRVPIGEEISGWVARHGQPVLVCNIEEDDRFGRRNRPTYETKSLLSVPLTTGGRVIGVLNVSNRVSCTSFTADDRDLLACLADRLAVVLEQVVRGEDVAGVLPPTQQALQAIIDARRRSGVTGSPEFQRVLEGVCRRMGMQRADVEIMRYIWDIHDVGMTRVEESIVSKPGKLEPEELSQVRNHPRIGVEILSPVEFLEQVKQVVLHHHEWFDGSGYPDGLEGEAIPLGARVLAVLDAFGSMTSERPYRRTRTSEEAIEEIDRCAGTQFDPEVAGALVEEWREVEARSEKAREPVGSGVSRS